MSKQAKYSAYPRPLFFAFVLVPLGIMFYLAYTYHPELLTQHLFSNPDAYHYWLIASNIIEHATFSRSSEPPLIPDFIRTPLFPIIITMARLIYDLPLSVYIVQAFFYVLGCLMIFKINTLIFSTEKSGKLGFVLMRRLHKRERKYCPTIYPGYYEIG